MEYEFTPMKHAYEWDWVKDRTSCLWVEDTKGIVMRDAGSRQIVAAVALDNWTETGVQVHMAIDRPAVLRRGFIQEVCEYVFKTCKRNILMGFVPGDNDRALRLNKRLGLDIVHTIPDGVSKGVDYHLMEMRRENCRWLT